MTKPSPKKLLNALDKWGVDYQIMPKWDDPSIDPYDENFTPTGVVLHHTAGVDSLAFCMRGTYPPVRNCHFLVARNGRVYALAAGGCYHAGQGGPSTVDGTYVPKDMGNRFFYGIEIESLGTSPSVTQKVSERSGMTPEQVASVSLLCNALLEALGKDGHWDAIIRHKDWAPGRKIDVLQPIVYWRKQIRKAAESKTPVEPPKPPKPVTPPTLKPPVIKPPETPVKPSRPTEIVVRLSAVQPGNKNGAVAIVQKALKQEFPEFDYSSGPGVYGPLTKAAYARWQRRLGYRGKDADGVPGSQSLAVLGNRHGFKVIG